MKLTLLLFLSILLIGCNEQVAEKESDQQPVSKELESQEEKSEKQPADSYEQEGGGGH
ncbi:MAG: hypothetical protein R2799_04840 [Crocinitomicaceae bacterium]